MPIHSAFLRYFDAVCKSSSIRQAAVELHVASSAVNRQILKVEDELGVRLFERSHEGIRLTQAGELLAQHVTRTLSDVDRTLREISALQNRSADGLKVVAQGSVISRLLPPVLMSLYSEFPDRATSFMAAGGKGLHELLLNGSADIALMFDYKPVPGIQRIKQISLPVGVVMAPDHTLAAKKKRQLTLSDCAAYSLILPDESWPLRERLNKEIARAKPKIDLTAVTTSNSMEFLRAMLAEKKVLGFQTIVGLEAPLEEKSLVYIPLHNATGEPIAQTFSIGVSENRQRSEFLDRTLELLEQRLTEYETKTGVDLQLW